MKKLAKDLKLGDRIRGFNKAVGMLDAEFVVTSKRNVGLGSVEIETTNLADQTQKSLVYGNNQRVYIQE